LKGLAEQQTNRLDQSSDKNLSKNELRTDMIRLPLRVKMIAWKLEIRRKSPQHAVLHYKVAE